VRTCYVSGRAYADGGVVLLLRCVDDDAYADGI